MKSGDDVILASLYCFFDRRGGTACDIALSFEKIGRTWCQSVKQSWRAEEAPGAALAQKRMAFGFGCRQNKKIRFGRNLKSEAEMRSKPAQMLSKNK